LFNFYDIDNIYVIGDVHGCYHTLLKLINKLPKNAKIIFVGDLIDKGNYSVEVLELIINNPEKYFTIKGNHELLYLKYIKDIINNNIKGNLWSNNKKFGGYKTIYSYMKNIHLLEKHLSFIKNTKNYIEINNFFITHGYGLPYYDMKDLTKYQKKILSNCINSINYTGDYKVNYNKYNIINIYGHCSFKDIYRDNNTICIDTSCVYGFYLTAIKLDSIKLKIIDKDKKLIDKEQLIIFKENVCDKDIF